MAGDSKKLQPIIVKRVKKAAHGHHGGAWKIAYADFVTAMMAFFLLMWLLGSTSEGDRKGIADYFNSPLKVSLLGGGSGTGDSSHVIKGGGLDLSRTNGQVKKGDIEAERKTINLQALKDAARRAEAERLEGLRRRLDSALTNHPRLQQYKSQIRIDITADGLRIQIVDEHNRPMFDTGSALVKDYMRDILREIGKVLGETNNKITLAGHTDAAPYSSGERGYSNWELSADRANASRRELIAGGLREGQVVRVVGLASSSLLDAENPLNPVNRRISIIVMNRDAEERFERGGDVEAGSGPSVERALDVGASSPGANRR
ncbi:flagellar motor protein MotB [Caldimonas aquatica]|uniref:Flagellar motor protein MotB n=1 Tax=Caldimonas aquatica TaxID=376175 RepID=A0ABY6MUS4_9BURK|nr:flagellar motor protein MotB [Schlegelella aquatica]UZD55739.1 flagellar motor protein MotB [Schlegelella aquatica]